MIYAVLCFLTFVNGAALGFAAGYFVFGRKKAAEAPSEDPTDDELERAEKEREELIAAQKAFQTMMGYNADIAYGLDAEDDFTAGGS